MRYQFKQIIFSAILCCISGVAISQEQPSLRDRADEPYKRYEYSNAVPLYLKLADSRRPRLSDLEHLANSYVQMNDYEAAENWYARVIQHEDSDPENLIRYGEVLKTNGKYAEAKKQLQAYAAATGNADRVALALAGCDSAMVWMANPTLHKLRNEEINTPLSEFSAFPIGEQVYYAGEPGGVTRSMDTYGWTGNSFLRVYTANRSLDNTLSDAAMVAGDINEGQFHVGPVAAPRGIASAAPEQ